MKKAYFTKAAFQFLVDLKDNNNRAWFLENKTVYENQVKQPFLRFIADFAGPLAKINPHYVADPRPVGGSLFRIHRDARFSHDKTPYKTNAAAQFRHRDRERDRHLPAFYLHLEPGESFACAGVWQPESADLLAIRKAIAGRSAAWERALAGAPPLWEADSLRRPPKGFPPDHPFIADIRRRHFLPMVEFSDSQVCSPGFFEAVARTFTKMDPVMRFLCKALRLKA